MIDWLDCLGLLPIAAVLALAYAVLILVVLFDSDPNSERNDP